MIGCVKMLCQWLLVSIPFFKDYHFASEREWRAVMNIDAVHKKDLHFEPSSGTLRPYIQMFSSESNLPITEVIVKAHGGTSVPLRPSHSFFAEYGYTSTKVVESEVPFAEGKKAPSSRESTDGLNSQQATAPDRSCCGYPPRGYSPSQRGLPLSRSLKTRFNKRTQPSGLY